MTNKFKQYAQYYCKKRKKEFPKKSIIVLMIMVITNV